MTISEVKAVAPPTIHRFFELMVPSRTSSAIFFLCVAAAQRACGSDGTRECVVQAGLGKGTLVLFVRGGERLELSRIRALAASHGPDLGVLQASPRQLHGPDLPPRGHNLRLAERKEKGALIVGVAVPAIHDPAEVRGAEGHGGHWHENHSK
jgi:hypothetical protein